MTQRTKRLVGMLSCLMTWLLTWDVTAVAQGLARRLPSDSGIDARINALIQREAAADRFSGIVLVARGDRIVMQRPYGFADWERRVPTSAATRFGVASITKLMTETLVDVLVDAGRLDMNAPVATYLTGFPNGPKGGHATIRDLVTHRAGVPHRVTTELEETGTLHAADIVERVKAHGLLTEPGTTELYSSAGFTCLARVIEIVEKTSFDRVLAARIFQPASMKMATDETGQQLMTGRALPYVLEQGPISVATASAPYKDLSFLSGAGSVYASATDLLHFVRALHGGTFGKVAQQLLGNAVDTTWTGWYGRINGYEGSVDYLPASDLTFILLSNLQSAANWQIRQRVRSILLGRTITSIAAPPPVAPRFESSAQIVGSYGDPTDPIVVMEKDGRLFRDGDAIYPTSGGVYYEPVSGATMHFARDTKGNVVSVKTRFTPDAPERVQPRIGAR